MCRRRPQVQCDDLIRKRSSSSGKRPVQKGRIWWQYQHDCRSGISTKHAIPLPAKADLFFELISAKIGQYFLGLDEQFEI